MEHGVAVILAPLLPALAAAMVYMTAAAMATKATVSSALERIVRYLTRLAYSSPSIATPPPLTLVSGASPTAPNPEVLGVMSDAGATATIMAVLEDELHRLPAHMDGECFVLMWLMLTCRRPTERCPPREHVAQRPLSCGTRAAQRLVSTLMTVLPTGSASASPLRDHRYAVAGLVAYIAADPLSRTNLLHAKLPEALVTALSTSDRVLFRKVDGALRALVESPAQTAHYHANRAASATRRLLDQLVDRYRVPIHSFPPPYPLLVPMRALGPVCVLSRRLWLRSCRCVSMSGESRLSSYIARLMTGNGGYADTAAAPTRSERGTTRTSSRRAMRVSSRSPLSPNSWRLLAWGPPCWYDWCMRPTFFFMASCRMRQRTPPWWSPHGSLPGGRC